MGRWHIVTGPFASSAPQTDMKISWLPTIAAAAVISTVIRAAAFTPLEAKQGAAQKIFYIHVPAAWVAFLAFFLVAVSSGVYLWLRDARLDRFAESSAEVGVVFTTVVLLTGPLGRSRSGEGTGRGGTCDSSRRYFCGSSTSPTWCCAAPSSRRRCERGIQPYSGFSARF